VNLRTNFDKNQTRNGSAIVDISLKINQTEVNSCACAFTTSGVIGRRT